VVRATPDEAAMKPNVVAKAYIDSAGAARVDPGGSAGCCKASSISGHAGPRGHDAAARHRRGRDDCDVGDVRTLFREQEYSRFPVYKESLDHIVGFVFGEGVVR